MQQRPRPPRVPFVAGVLGAFALVVPVPAAGRENPSGSEWLPAVQASEQLSGPALVEGRFVDGRGRPVGEGHVVVLAWPTAETLGPLSDGARVEMIALGKATTGPDGHFVLRADPSIALTGFMEDDGTVNFDIVAVAVDGRRARYSSFRQWGNQSSAWIERDRAATDAVKAAHVVLTAHEAPNVSGGSAPATTHSGNCGAQVVATYNDRLGVIGEVYTGPHANARFTYVSGSSSALGVGYSASGSFGSFSQTGEASMSSTAGITWPQVGTNTKKVYQTTWQYKQFKLWDWDYWGTACYYSGYEARPTAWWGGAASYNAASAPAANYCATIQSGVELWKDRRTAVTFTNGLDLNIGALGIYLSTRTGFNTTTKIWFKFVAAGQMCGSNAPWPDAARVVAK